MSSLLDLFSLFISLSLTLTEFFSFLFPGINGWNVDYKSSPATTGFVAVSVGDSKASEFYEDLQEKLKNVQYADTLQKTYPETFKLLLPDQEASLEEAIDEMRDAFEKQEERFEFNAKDGKVVLNSNFSNTCNLRINLHYYESKEKFIDGEYNFLLNQMLIPAEKITSDGLRICIDGKVSLNSLVITQESLGGERLPTNISIISQNKDGSDELHVGAMSAMIQNIETNIKFGEKLKCVIGERYTTSDELKDIAAGLSVTSFSKCMTTQEGREEAIYYSAANRESDGLTSILKLSLGKEAVVRISDGAPGARNFLFSDKVSISLDKNAKMYIEQKKNMSLKTALSYLGLNLSGDKTTESTIAFAMRGILENTIDLAEGAGFISIVEEPIKNMSVKVVTQQTISLNLSTPLFSYTPIEVVDPSGRVTINKTKKLSDIFSVDESLKNSFSLESDVTLDMIISQNLQSDIGEGQTLKGVTGLDADQIAFVYEPEIILGDGTLEVYEQQPEDKGEKVAANKEEAADGKSQSDSGCIFPKTNDEIFVSPLVNLLALAFVVLAYAKRRV